MKRCLGPVTPVISNFSAFISEFAKLSYDAPFLAQSLQQISFWLNRIPYKNPRQAQVYSKRSLYQLLRAASEPHHALREL